jgi:ankyrin repeat protein
MRWLLEHGADPNVPPRRGNTADLLTLAAATYSPSTVKLLVEHGARRKGTLALHAAATTSAIEIDQGNFQPVLSRVEILKILLDHGADANEMEVDPKAFRRPRASYTGTPLHRAVKDGSVEAVQCLLTYGADVSSPSWSGLTVMKAAQMHGRQDMVDILRNHIDRDSCQDDLSVSKTISKDGL